MWECAYTHTHIHRHNALWRVRRLYLLLSACFKGFLNPSRLTSYYPWGCSSKGRQPGQQREEGGMHCHHPVLAADTWRTPANSPEAHNVSTTRALSAGRQGSPCLPRSWWHDQTSQHVCTLQITLSTVLKIWQNIFTSHFYFEDLYSIPAIMKYF